MQGMDINTLAHKVVSTIGLGGYYSNVLVKYVTTSTIDVSWDSLYINGVDTGAQSFTIDTSLSGVLGIDTGSIAINKWYYIFAVRGTAGVSVIFSLSEILPALPTGYDEYRLVSMFYSDASSLVSTFYQQDTTYFYDARKTVLTGGTSSSSVVINLETWVPKTVNTLVMNCKYQARTTTSGNIQLDGYVNGQYCQQSRLIGQLNSGDDFTSYFEIITYNRKIQYNVGVSANTDTQLFLFGFKVVL